MALAPISVEQRVRYAVEFKTHAGNPAVVDGIPVWSIDNEAIAHLEPEADGMHCSLISDGMGDVNVTVLGDADMGAGVIPVSRTELQTITGAGAETAEIVAEPATPK